MTHRLPTPGGDDGTWGNVLNDFLSVEHNTDGTLKLRADGTLTGMVKAILPETYGAIGNGTTDDAAAWQQAINVQQTTGGYIYAAQRYYIGTPLVAAPGTAGAWTDSTRPLVIKGAGMDITALIAGGQFNYGGLLQGGSGGVNPKAAQVIVEDLTLDGNYTGAGGSVAQPASGAGALVSLPWPGTSLSASSYNGRYHVFSRVRFYRPSGYGFQPTQGVKLDHCTFDTTGQPGASIHYDNLGSGAGDAVVTACTWLNSDGNYADFVATSGMIRLIMIGCESYNHGTGGIYACGSSSIIVGNRLNNAGLSGVGYDAGTAAGLRSANVVTGNVLSNLDVNNSGLSVTYGDMVYGNVSADGSGGADFWQRIHAADGVELPAITHALPGAGLYGDGTNIYAQTAAAGTIFLRPGGPGSNNDMVAVGGGGLSFYDGAGGAQARLSSGTGAPSGGTSGDFYLRIDTPGTANQRLYVNNGGTWTGIV